MPTETTSNSPVPRDGVEIGAWRLYPSLNEIRQGETVVNLEPKTVALLVYLAGRVGETVSREELLSQVWPGSVVSDDSLTQAVIKLRKALCDQPRSPRYIKTIPKRGYRLIAPVDNPRDKQAGEAQNLPVPRKRLLRSGPIATVATLVALLLTFGYLGITELRKGDASYSNPPYTTDMGETGNNEPLTVALLPFKTLRQGTDQENFARGFAADLSTDLSKLSSLWVISLPSVYRSDAEPGQAGTPPARYLISGSVQRTSDRLVTHIRLIDANTRRQLWSERFDRPYSDLFDVQSEISKQVVKLLAVKVTAAEHRRMAQPYTRNLDAYEYFLQGQADLLVRRESENRSARDMYRRAISLDPTFARAYAGLALSHVADYRNQWTDDSTASLARAREMAETAVQIDPDIPEIYWVLGYIQAQHRRHTEAIQHLQRALKLDQSFADAYALMGGISTYSGNPGESVPLLHQAIRLNPDAGYLYFLLLGRAYFFLGDQEQALINLREALSRNPVNLEAHVYLAAATAAVGDMESAQWEVDEIRAIQPGFVTRAWLETYPMTDAGQIRRLIARMKTLGL